MNFNNNYISIKYIHILFFLYLFSTSDGLIDDLGTKGTNRISSGDASSDCGELLSSFAVASGNFTYCAIRHARPIMICQRCIKSYLNVRRVFNDIVKLKDRGGETCKDELINLDRLQTVDAGFKYVTDLWARASCNTCFESDGKSFQPPPLTPPVQEILNTSAILKKCIESHHNESIPDNLTICKSCLDDYVKLNDLYRSIKEDNGEINFCMDIIDLMNSTRFDWSNELGCCGDRKKPEIIFLISSAIVFILPILFYYMVYSFTSKKQHKLAQQTRWHEGCSIQDSR